MLGSYRSRRIIFTSPCLLLAEEQHEQRQEDERELNIVKYIGLPQSPLSGAETRDIWGHCRHTLRPREATQILVRTRDPVHVGYQKNKLQLFPAWRTPAAGIRRNLKKYSAGVVSDVICDRFTPAKQGVQSGYTISPLKFVHVSLKIKKTIWMPDRFP